MIPAALPPPARYFTLSGVQAGSQPTHAVSPPPMPAHVSCSNIVHICGPVQWGWLAQVAGTQAEAQARGWLADRLRALPAQLPLPRDARGRPQLQVSHPFHDCNWSHSGDGLLVALAQGVRVGVDIERERPRPRAVALAQRYFTVEEAAWLGATAETERDRAFLRLWCAKEAVLKAHGHGLAFGLHRLRFEARDDALRLVACDEALGRPAQWQLHELTPAPGYLGMLAWRE